MCEITVTCPLCSEAVTPEQETSCSTGMDMDYGRPGSVRIERSRVTWLCPCGAKVTLSAER